jgi:hypothetical protein
MPTMSSYELKVTGLVKANDHDPEEIFARFQELMDHRTPWAEKFGLVYDLVKKLDKDTPPILEAWQIAIGSTLAEQSWIGDGSWLNGQPVPAGGCKVPIGQSVAVTDRTVLCPTSIVAKDSQLRRAPYTKLAWEIRMEESPQWNLDMNDQPYIAGTYHLLVFQGVMGVARPGAFGEHWDNQSAPYELWWFYKYKSLPWFKELMGALLRFNRAFAGRLEESARVRDLKWYCGNGAGP